ncbi:MAG: hypothetical protein JSW03_06890 [Candidatus Eiseniibacteriota bacterium]|nr:MAG: hypothetical protein JSW03_06890 [Candidatus Eisenbacteria bacterium]
MSVPEKARQRYAEGGMLRLAESLANGLRRFLSTRVFSIRKARLLEWSLTGPIPNVEPPGIEIDVRELREEEIPRFKNIVREEKLELWRRRLRQGKVALVAWHGDEVAWFGWVSRQFEYETTFDVNLPLKEDEGYVLDAYTVPQYRGHDLHTYMSVKRLQKLKDLGARKAYGIAAKQNVASRRAHQKGGAVETKGITRVNILGIRFHLWKDLKGRE